MNEHFSNIGHKEQRTMRPQERPLLNFLQEKKPMGKRDNNAQYVDKLRRTFPAYTLFRLRENERVLVRLSEDNPEKVCPHGSKSYPKMDYVGVKWAPKKKKDRSSITGTSSDLSRKITFPLRETRKRLR